MTDSQHHSFVNNRVLKFNVGFLLAQGAGYQRDIDIDLPLVRVDEDLDLDYLRGSLRLSRNSRGILVQGTLETGVISDCVRCLTPVLVPVTFELEELFAFPASDESVYAVDETGTLNLAPLVREEAILAMPIGVLCRPDCAGLCVECGQNLNEAACDCVREAVHPGLEVLRAHLDQTNVQDNE